jgi:hypothetical protein
LNGGIGFNLHQSAHLPSAEPHDRRTVSKAKNSQLALVQGCSSTGLTYVALAHDYTESASQQTILCLTHSEDMTSSDGSSLTLRLSSSGLISSRSLRLAIASCCQLVRLSGHLDIVIQPLVPRFGPRSDHLASECIVLGVLLNSDVQE